MLYRLRPQESLEWSDFPGFDMFDTAAAAGADFDRLEWQPAEARAVSADLLRLALRHGVSTGSGLVISARHTVALGRADDIRVSLIAADEAQAELRASTGELMEHLMPGWTEQGRELDQRVRDSSEAAARESEEDLADELAAPVKAALAEHWVHLGGSLPD